MNRNVIIACLSLLLTASATGRALAHEPDAGSSRTVNLSTNPLGYLVGTYGVSMSVTLGSHVALRGDLNYYLPEDEAKGLEAGVGLPIYFGRAYDSWFLEPGAIVRKIETDDNTYETTTFGPQVLLGCHWMWDSGLNLALALGAGRNWSTNDSRELDSDDEEWFGNGYLRFGYAF